MALIAGGELSRDRNIQIDEPARNSGSDRLIYNSDNDYRDTGSDMVGGLDSITRENRDREREAGREAIAPTSQPISAPIPKPANPVVHVEERRTVTAVRDEQDEPKPEDDSPTRKNQGLEFANQAGYGVDLNKIFAEYWQYIGGFLLLFTILTFRK